MSTPETPGFADERCRDLEPDARRVAASLVRAALPDLYAKLDDDLALDIIGKQFAEDRTEVSETEAAVVDGRVLGIVAGYPTRDFGARQSASLHHMLSNVPADMMGDIVAHVRSATGAIQTPPEEGHYLARIAVLPEMAGRGLADLLLARFAEGGQEPHVLHVRGDNARAISFYRRHGFHLEPGNAAIPLMIRADAKA